MNNGIFDFKTLKQELKIRGYSQRTQEVYLYYNHQFLLFCKKKTLQVTTQDVKDYLEYLIDQKKSRATIRLAHNAILFYYSRILKRKIMVNVKLPKNERKAIITLTKEEISQIINVISNPKHRLLIEFIYGSGLRVSEVVKIKTEDILIDEKIAVVRNTKSKRDRPVVLSDKFIEDFKNYISFNRGKYLFSGRNGHLTSRSIQEIIKKAAQKAVIKKKVYPHLLRHSFATQLLDNHVDLKYIQKLLGHKDLKTTQIYTHVSFKELQKIKSPLDD